MTSSAPGAFIPQTEAPRIHHAHEISGPAQPDTPARRLRGAVAPVMGLLRPYFGSFALALAALAIAVPIDVLFNITSLARIFFIVVLISAISWGLWPSMFAALISTVIYDFFFIPPIYSLAIESPAGLVNLVFFVVTSVIVSGLATRVRRYAVMADKRALTAEQLSAFTRRIGIAPTVDDILVCASNEIAAAVGLPAVTLLAEDGCSITGPSRTGSTPDTDLLARLERVRAVGPDLPETLILDAWQFECLACGEGIYCLIGVCRARETDVLSRDQRHLLQAFGQQTGSAIKQNRLRQRLSEARIRAESEEFGGALLNSVSHDLRGPLTTILGATSALDAHWPSLRDSAKLELVRTARAETEHLSRYIANLLDITRIASGAIGPKLEPLPLADLVGAAVHKTRNGLASHRLRIDVPEELPLVAADGMLLQQIMFNLLDNAAKYAPEGSLVSLVAEADGNAVRLRILDEGPGVPEDELDRIFDKFFRSAATRAGQPGTGLGLTICRGLVEAMHGTICASNRTERTGMCVSIVLPLVRENQLHRVEVT